MILILFQVNSNKWPQEWIYTYTQTDRQIHTFIYVGTKVTSGNYIQRYCCVAAGIELKSKQIIAIQSKIDVLATSTHNNKMMCIK